MAELRNLGKEECISLLKSGVVGRVAVTAPDGPHIVPVNYSIVDEAIVVRTAPYTVLGAYARGAALAFEVDHFDYDQHHGWSVLARGRGEMVEEYAQLEHIKDIWEPRPWAAGTRTMFIRIPWRELTGRSIGDIIRPVDRIVTDGQGYSADSTSQPSPD